MQAWTDSEKREVEKVKPLTERQRKERIATLDYLIGEALKPNHEDACVLAIGQRAYWQRPRVMGGEYTPAAAEPHIGGQCSCWTRKAATWLKLERFALLTLDEREKALKEIGL